jgi:hypothetical protein
MSHHLHSKPPSFCAAMRGPKRSTLMGAKSIVEETLRGDLLSARRGVESLKLVVHEVAVVLLEILEDIPVLDLQEKFARSVLTTQGPIMHGAFC